MPKLPLGTKLKLLRERRGWSVHLACEKTGWEVKRESLSRLETGRTDPEKVALRTALHLIEIYWPDLDISDFTRRKPWRTYTIGEK